MRGRKERNSEKAVLKGKFGKETQKKQMRRRGRKRRRREGKCHRPTQDKADTILLFAQGFALYRKREREKKTKRKIISFLSQKFLDFFLSPKSLKTTNIQDISRKISTFTSRENLGGRKVTQEWTAGERRGEKKRRKQR